MLASAQTSWNAKGMLLTESLMGVGGIAIFFSASFIVKRVVRADPAAAPTP